jgi:hypothetical protein
MTLIKYFNAELGQAFKALGELRCNNPPKVRSILFF